MDNKENLTKWISDIETQLGSGRNGWTEVRQLEWRKKQLQERLAKINNRETE